MRRYDKSVMSINANYTYDLASPRESPGYLIFQASPVPTNAKPSLSLLVGSFPIHKRIVFRNPSSISHPSLSSTQTAFPFIPSMVFRRTDRLGSGPKFVYDRNGHTVHNILSAMLIRKVRIESDFSCRKAKILLNHHTT